MVVGAVQRPLELREEVLGLVGYDLAALVRTYSPAAWSTDSWRTNSCPSCGVADVAVGIEDRSSHIDLLRNGLAQRRSGHVRDDRERTSPVFLLTNDNTVVRWGLVAG